MPGPLLALNKVAIAAVAVVVIGILLLTTPSLRNGDTVHKLKESAQTAANNMCNNDRPLFGHLTMSDTFLRLFENIHYPITQQSYTDASGKVFDIKEDAPWWNKPLRDEVLILDIDTRMPKGRNELFSENRLDWEDLSVEGEGTMISAAFMNHFLYSQVHGYDYRFFNAHEMEGYHSTWVKPHVLYDILHSYRFVIILDADSTIQHLELPIEWLFNRWGITPQTSIAMPLDTRQNLHGDEHASEDNRGKLQLNTGVVIAQALPHTFELLKAWKECPEETRYPGCAAWKQTWSHEQKAFSQYIRYDYNPSGTNIVEIPCNDAMGYPGLIDHEWIQSNCTGQFIRHHTLDKAVTKKSAEIAMLQALTDLTRKSLLSNLDAFWIEEAR